MQEGNGHFDSKQWWGAMLGNPLSFKKINCQDAFFEQITPSLAIDYFISCQQFIIKFIINLRITHYKLNHFS